tara:strand:+ start:274 stop:789 length:516 start_codon:yes stop_codon:yes gene_type:complete
MTNKNLHRTIMLSGGFDPIHIGHVRMILAAQKLLSENGSIIIAANSDEWLMRKKGYIFMPWDERAEILRAIKGVAEVTVVDDADGTVCEALRRLEPDLFGNGGDRNNKNTPEKAVCKELGIKMVWGLGGSKIQSSSDLVKDSNLISELGMEDLDVGAPSKRILLRGKGCEN